MDGSVVSFAFVVLIGLRIYRRCFFLVIGAFRRCIFVFGCRKCLLRWRLSFVVNSGS